MSDRVFYAETSRSNFLVCERSPISDRKLLVVCTVRTETQAKRLVKLLGRLNASGEESLGG